MPRDLTNGTFKDIRRGVPPESSESYSSTRVHPSVSPYGSRDGSPVRSDHATGQLTTDISTLSLSVNYLPSKFSSGVLASQAGGGGGGGGGEGTARRRPATQDDSIDFLGVPKMGGGVDVFKSGEARMGGEGDEDEDVYIDDKRSTTNNRWFERGRRRKSLQHKRKLRWNKFKWILFISNTLVSLPPVIYRTDRKSVV